MGSKVLDVVSTSPSEINVVFGNFDLPYQKQFFNALLLLTSAFHVLLSLTYAPRLLNAGIFSSPLAKELASLVALTTTWCFYTAWDLGRVDAIEIPVLEVWAYIFIGTVACGPAAALAGTWEWRAVRLADARSAKGLLACKAER